MDNRILIIFLISIVLFNITTQASSKNKKVKSPFKDVCGKQNLTTISRIFGGVHAEMGEFPWLVRLLHRSKDGKLIPGCSGFIIHKKFVMTAAHCVVKSIIDANGPVEQILLGEHDTLKSLDCKLFNRAHVCTDPPVYAHTKPRKTIIHKDYKDNSHDRSHFCDIALLQLKKPIKYTRYIQPICLTEEESEEEHMFISGWGRTESTSGSNTKLKAQVPRSDLDECIETYDTFDVTIDESQICAGGVSGTDTCSGDSGGPLMVHLNGTWYAEGIVSFGRECGLQGWPGIYTNIPYYYEWIKKNIVNRLKYDREIAPVKKLEAAKKPKI